MLSSIVLNIFCKSSQISRLKVHRVRELVLRQFFWKIMKKFFNFNSCAVFCQECVKILISPKMKAIARKYRQLKKLPLKFKHNVWCNKNFLSEVLAEVDRKLRFSTLSTRWLYPFNGFMIPELMYMAHIIWGYHIRLYHLVIG